MNVTAKNAIITTALITIAAMNSYILLLVLAIKISATAIQENKTMYGKERNSKYFFTYFFFEDSAIVAPRFQRDYTIILNACKE